MFLHCSYRERDIMNTERIIENAAKKSGIDYPVDEKTREFSESFLRSLNDGINWANGREHNLIKVNIHKWLEDLQREIDEESEADES